jgi:hypothetical protein
VLGRTAAGTRSTGSRVAALLLRGTSGGGRCQARTKEADGASIQGLNYRFFEQLAEAEAEAYLGTFLEEERKRIPPLWWERLMEDGAAAIEPCFAEFVPRIRLLQVAPPDDLPEYIVESMQRGHGGLPDFASHAGRVAVLAAAFYFGEAFQCGFASLSSAVGRVERAEEGQPVVTGFSDLDLLALTVAENLVLEYERDPSRVATAVDYWRHFV